MTPQRLAQRGVRVHVVPAASTVADIEAYAPDGVFFSNGPGDPSAATHEVELLRGVLDRGTPFFGICFGNQILGRALGYGTYKLAYGHRGINQPVMDRRTGKVEVTAHNHGFAVDAPLDGESVAPHDGGRYGRVVVSHVGLNDQVVEGSSASTCPPSPSSTTRGRGRPPRRRVPLRPLRRAHDVASRRRRGGRRLRRRRADHQES